MRYVCVCVWVHQAEALGVEDGLGNTVTKAHHKMFAPLVNVQGMAYYSCLVIVEWMSQYQSLPASIDTALQGINTLCTCVKN